MTKEKEKGQLIVLSGPSGVGKSTVIAELLGQRKGIYFSVSYTTRQPRVGEADGIKMCIRDSSHSRIKHHNENSPFKMFLRLSTRHSLATRMASISSTALETWALITR